MSKKDLKKSRRWRWLILIGAAIILTGVWQFAFHPFHEEEKALRRQLRDAVARKFPDQAARVAASFGLHHFEPNRNKPQEKSPLDHPVVLIHGLDDPGKVWMNLAPVLAGEAFDVWEMHYPNDQPVEESARFFFEKLKVFKKLGAERIMIVAHSMGGLVAREMLTNPALAYMQAVRTEDVPGVTGLIMVGTPNHGSEFARFRVFAEFRDQWVHAVKGKGHWLRWLLDGAGEAKIDLLPGSRFLTSLNARPHPEGVNMSIIAGIAGPVDDDEIEDLIKSLHEKLPDDAHTMLDKLEGALKSAAHGLGDGLVTISSTRLAGIRHRTVNGTHRSIIRNISKGSVRVPPAVPIILEQIKKNDGFSEG